ncbi:MAG: hypothetical protein EBT02_12085 [Planctomycetia bacterium]|nr:hypothetical protein [Planctomycetia bacterium]
MFSKITHALLFLLLITNLFACGNKAPEGDSNEKTISDSFLKLIACIKSVPKKRSDIRESRKR